MASYLLFLLGLGPLLVLLTAAVAAALGLHPLVGPEPGSWFQRIGWTVSYGVPLAVIAVTLVGHAIREHSSGYAFSAGLLINVVATLVLLMRLHAAGQPFDPHAWILVAQINAIVAALTALLWLAALTWHASAQAERKRSPLLPRLLRFQLLLAGSLFTVVVIGAILKLVVTPIPTGWVLTAGSPLSWLALALVAMGAIWISRFAHAEYQLDLARLAGPLSAVLVMLVALSAARLAPQAWQGYYTLLAGCTVAAWCLPLLLKPVTGGTSHWSTPATTGFAVAATLLALRNLGAYPTGLWWTIGPLLVLSARAVWIAFCAGRRGPVWIGAMLLHPAMTLWWLDSGYLLTGTRGTGRLSELLWINLLAAAVMAGLSLVVERRLLTRSQLAAALNSQIPESSHRTGLKRPSQAFLQRIGTVLGLHRVAAWVMLLVLLATTCGGLWADWNGHPFETHAALAWTAWLAALATALGCCWDPATRWPISALYLIGLTAVGLLLDRLDLPRDLFAWSLACALSAYSLATSTMWSGRQRWITAAIKRRIPLALDQSVAMQNGNSHSLLQAGHRWMVGANGLIGLVVLMLVVPIEILTPDWKQRMIGAYALGATALALGLLAHDTVRASLQTVALLGAGLFAIAFGWAWLPPDFPAPWLHRLIVACAALAIVTGVYTMGLVKLLRRENGWTRAAAKLVPVLLVITAILLIGVLAIEIFTYLQHRQAPAIAWPALLAVALALLGLVAVSLGCALLPGRDPLGLSERGRTVYVYAAEGLLVLLGVHIRVTMPWLFHGWFLQFWPLLVMGLAFVGVGLGELFRRRQQTVLSLPLETTGVLLPLLPVLGFGFVSSQIHYSLLLLSVGVLYAGQSVLRRSYAFGILAAVAAHGSLWYLLWSREGMKLTDHPQMWLIPPALSVLVASTLNRQRLSREQLAAIRYATAIVIYVSSTTEIFLHGVAQAPWLPAVLAGLSILGVLAGIWLRVRAFLYLGTSFLLVALLTVIWQAAVSQQRTWIWWIAGLVTGVLIIALFGLFERRRDDVLKMVDKLKEWEE